MSVLVVALVVLAGAVAGWWMLRDLRTLPRGGGDAQGATRAASVSVVVPARDEEASLPALLASLALLDEPVREVVVVDDGSRDATAAVAARAGARVLPLSPPPAGWTGKAWACDRGARATSGETLLFLDADTVLAPHALAGLLELLERHGGLVSVQPFHLTERTHEQLSSYFNVVSMLASGAFAGRPASRPMAFGPCLLTSRADLQRAGGHAAVRGEVLDDVELAGAFHRAGLPVLCAVGGGSVRMRSYPGGLRQLVQGWTKNIASGASAAAPGPTVAAVLWLGVHHAVAVGAVLGLLGHLGAWVGPAALGHPVAWLLGWVLVAWQLRRLLGRIGAFRWWTWAVFPVPLLAFDAVFARSVVLTVVRGSVSWRDREVGVGPRARTRKEA